jgi:hypothetical protein
MEIIINDTAFSYIGCTYDVCLSNSSCNRLYIENWISWQRNIINNTIQMEKNTITFIKFQLWGFFFQNTTDLCFHVFRDQNESLKILHKNVTIVNGTVNCFRCRYNYENIISGISALIIKLSNLVTSYNSSNDERLTTFFNMNNPIYECPLSLVTTSQTIPRAMMDNNKSKDENVINLIIIVTCLVFGLALLVAFIVCFIYCAMHRHGYSLTATS